MSPFIEEVLLLLGAAILCIIFYFLGAKIGYKSKFPYNFFGILGVITNLAVSFFSARIFYIRIMAISSKEFLEDTHHYASGNTMDGNGFIFWSSWVVFTIVFVILFNIGKK